MNRLKVEETFHIEGRGTVWLVQDVGDLSIKRGDIIECQSGQRMEVVDIEHRTGMDKPRGFGFIVKELSVVRLYDGFDNAWIDITEPLTYSEAEKFWNEKTNNGTRNVKFDDIDYYAIFSANSRMMYK